MATIELCQLGTVSQTTTVEGYAFESKVYTIEDAVQIARRTFAQTQLLAHNRLPGETSLPGPDNFRPFVTYHENVKAGTRVLLYRDEIRSKGWYSEINGYGGNICGFVGNSTYREVDPIRYICAKKVRQEEEICVPKLIGTVKQNFLNPGALNEDRSVYLSDFILLAMLEQNYIGIDKTAWQGDYGSPNTDIAHADGFIKIACKAMASDAAKPAIVAHQFANMQNTQFIEGRQGGTTIRVAWDTDLATTLGNFETALEALVDAYGNAVYSDVTVSGGDTITVTTQPGELYDLVFVVTNGDGFDFDLDGRICGPKTAVSSVTVTTTVTQNAAQGNAPIGIEKVAITSANVMERLELLYNAIGDKDAKMLNPDWGAYLFVAPNVFHALKMAGYKHNAQYGASIFANPNAPVNIMGFEVVQMNYMPKDELFFARPQDLHFATDLQIDVQEIRQGFDDKEGSAWFKNALTIGFQISEPALVAGTFCNRDSDFGALMPCDLTTFDGTTA